MVLKMSSFCGRTAGASLKIGLELPTGNLWICSAALAAAEACVSAGFYSKGRRAGGPGGGNTELWLSLLQHNGILKT